MTPSLQRSHALDPYELAPPPAVAESAHRSSATGTGNDAEGMPHVVIGLTALASVFLSMLIGIVLVSQESLGVAEAVALSLVAIPMLVAWLMRRANRERTSKHPS